MIRDFPPMPLSKLIQRKKDEIIIQELETYSRITIHLNGRGISVRDKVLGRNIGTKRQFVVKAGQLVLSKIDARNGAFGVVPTTCDSAIITGNFWTFDVNQELLDVKFFDFLTKTPMFIDFCVRASDGTTNRRYLQESKFLSQKILLPPLEEQQRIVARIEELAAKIEEARGLRREAAKEADELLNAELDRVFANVAKTFEAIVIGQSGGFVTSGPRGWGDYYSEDGDRRLIRVENVMNRDLDLSIAAKVAVPSYEGDIERSQVRIGDVLVTITGAIGRVGVVRNIDEPSHVSQHVALVRVPDTISPYYLYWYLRAPTFGRSQTEGKTYGATKPGINLTNLRMLQIATPSMEQQQAIIAYFDDLEAKVNILKQLQSESAAELDALLPSILDKAFKGEL